MENKINQWLTAFESAVHTRRTFFVAAWFAVLLALVSVVGGSKWAMASCALSLGVLAHTGMAMLESMGIFADTINRIAGTYEKEMRSAIEKKLEASAPNSQPAKVN